MTKINIKKYEKQLLKLKGVQGIGEGHKITKGVSTGKKAILIFVKEKIPETKIQKSQIIPKKLGNYETDIIEVGEVKIHTDGRQTRIRPAKPGVSIGTLDVTAGTLGLIVYKNKYPYILTNNHVIGEIFKGAPSAKGKEVIQPGKYDGGTGIDIIALVDDYIEIDKNNCFVDCAIAKVLDPNDIDNDILGIGFIKGMAEPEIGLSCKKSGRTSGYTTGKILATGVTINVGYEKGTVICRDQILFENMSQGGDSGSVILSEDNLAVGLLFAGSDKVTVANPIGRVLAYLGCDFYPPNSLARQFIDFVEELDEPYWSIKEKKEYYELLYNIIELENKIARNPSGNDEAKPKSCWLSKLFKKSKEGL